MQGGPSRSWFPCGQLLLFPHLTHPRTLPNTCGAEFYQDGFHHTGPWGVAPSYMTPRKPSCACADREVLLDLKSGHLISLLQQSSAPATSSALGVSGNHLLHLANSTCSALGLFFLLPQIPLRDENPKKCLFGR